MIATDDKPQIVFNKILYKFKLAKVDSSTIISKCEKVDKNKDRMIHIDDLEEIIQFALGENRLSMREMIFLLNSITHDKRRGIIIYDHIENFFDMERNESNNERWKNDGNTQSNSSVLPTGSIGEFLQKSACPIEIRNFQNFIALLEKYEKTSGMKATSTAEGFVVPLGPDLRVSIEFFIA